MSFGIDRERQARKLLEEDGWLIFRAAGSLGICDLVALKDGHRPRLVEVKATAAGPYHGFPPSDRHALSRAAYRAGADAELLWWPRRKQPKFIPEALWP